MATVYWQKLILRGFGPYRDEAVLELGDGINVAVAPNEAGKSTLTAGLAAILFGLSASSDVEKFSQGRFRHWGNPPQFEGELYFRVDGTDYHLHRWFASHRVVLRRSLGTNQWERLLEGVDNPEGRKPFARYHDELRRLLGINSLELFASTYFLAQPLPDASNLGTTLQQLLSGAGNRYTLALDKLEQATRELTRFYGPPLGLARNGRNDQRLERIEREIAELEATVAASQRSADGLPTIQRDLQHLAEQRQQLQRTLAARNKLKEVWGQWRSEQERHDMALERCQQIEQAAARAQRWAERHDQQLRELTSNYADFIGSDEHLAGQIEELARLAGSLTEVESELANCRTELEQRGQQWHTLEEKQRAMPSVLGQPSLLADHSRLLELSLAQTKLEERRSELERSVEESQGQLVGLSAYESFGEHPSTTLGELRQYLADQGRIFAQWHEGQRKSERLLASLCQDYRPFTDASPQQLQEVAQYRQRQWELKQRLQEVRHHGAILTDRQQAYTDQQQQLVQQYGSLADDPRTLLDLLHTKANLGDQISRLPSRRSPATRGLPGMLAGLLGGVVTLAVVWWWGRHAGVLGWVASVALGAVAFWLAGRGGQVMAPADSPEQRHLRQQLAEVDQHLGSLASLDFSARVELRGRLEKLMQCQAELPSPEAWQRAQRERQEAEDAWQQWQQAMRPFAERYDDPQSAYQEWQWLQQQIHELGQELQALTPSWMVGDPPSAAALSQLMNRPGLEPLLDLLQVSVGSPAELFDALRMREQDWPALLDRARAWEEGRRQLQQVQRALRDLDQAASDGSTAAQRIASEMAELTSRCAPFGGATAREELQEQVASYQELTRQLAALAAQIRLVEQRQHEKQGQYSRLTSQRQQIIDSLAGLWQNSGESLTRLRQRYDGYRQLRQQISDARQGLQEVLHSCQVETLAELEKLCIDQRLAVVACKNRWQGLIDGNPGLPALTDANRPQLVADLYQALIDELTELQQSQDALRQREEALLREKAGLEGQTPVNIAAAQDTLRALREEKAQVAVEVAALGMAYQELRAAIIDYESSYRGRLAERANTYHQGITGNDQRVVELADDFQVYCRSLDGQVISVDQLSQGTRDQLFISLRLAIADLISDQMNLPFIFDDPFVNCDQERLARIRTALGRVAGDRQVLLLTHQPELGAWGQTVTVSRQA